MFVDIRPFVSHSSRWWQDLGEFLEQPRFGVSPMSVSSSDGDAQRCCRLFNRESREVAKFDDLRDDRLLHREALQGFIQGKDILRCRNAGQIEFA